MLIYFLALITFVVWVALYGLYFRDHIKSWLENRFGKDTPPSSADASTDPIKSLDYSVRPKDD